MSVFVPGQLHGDLQSGRFTVDAFSSAQSTTSTPGYIVRYLPLDASFGSRGCSPGRNYTVVPSDSPVWRVIMEPAMC